MSCNKGDTVVWHPVRARACLCGLAWFSPETCMFKMIGDSKQPVGVSVKVNAVRVCVCVLQTS